MLEATFVEAVVEVVVDCDGCAGVLTVAPGVFCGCGDGAAVSGKKCSSEKGVPASNSSKSLYFFFVRQLAKSDKRQFNEQPFVFTYAVVQTALIGECQRFYQKIRVARLGLPFVLLFRFFTHFK